MKGCTHYPSEFCSRCLPECDECGAREERITVLIEENRALRDLVREFQDASMLGNHQDHPDDVTPAHLRQAVQDWGDEIDRLKCELELTRHHYDHARNELSKRLQEQSK